jgi:hypothetical protein
LVFFRRFKVGLSRYIGSVIPRVKGALDEKLFAGFIYSSPYTTKVMFHTTGNFCDHRINVSLLFKKNFEFELNFSNSTNYEKFLKKVPNIIKNALFFLQIFVTVFFSNQRKKLFKMATLTFCEDDHIFFICYLKNHMTFLLDFRSKLFGNILKIFLISSSKIFKLIFMESMAENIGNAYFYYIQIYPRFVSLLLYVL